MRGGRFQQKAIQDVNLRSAEALFETRTVSEIREVESKTRKEIEEKKEELRQLVGTSYRDLIESADSILLMKKSCQAVSENIRSIETGFRSLSKTISEVVPLTPQVISVKKKRETLYGIGSRVKYLVDTAESIWGCLDEHMFLEASGRYLRAKEVYSLLIQNNEELLGNSFPLIRHQWQLVENFRAQISQRSRDRLMEQGLGIDSYAVALAAVAVIDELNPSQVLSLFLDTRRSWLRQKSGLVGTGIDAASVASVFCNVVRIIQLTLCQIGELFLEVLNDLPLFYKIVLAVPPGSQLFGGIPNPDNEVQLWKSHREKLECTMVNLPAEFIAETCVSWLRSCAEDVISSDRVGGKYLLDVLNSGRELAEVERLIRKTLDRQEALEGSIEWLKSVFGSRIESPWHCVCELVLREPKNLWDELFETMFVDRMKRVVDYGFAELSKRVNIGECLAALVTTPGSKKDLQAGLQKSTGGGGLFVAGGGAKGGVEPYRSKAGLSFRVTTKDDEDWFGCLNVYFGTEVSRIRDTVDEVLKNILEDLICFLNAHKSASRTKELAPHLQEQCFQCMSTIIRELEGHLSNLSVNLNKEMEIEKNSEMRDKEALQHPVIVERALFVGRLLVALSFYSNSIPLILGSPQRWFLEDESAISGKGSSIFRYLRMDFDHSTLENSWRQLPTRGIGVNPQGLHDGDSTKLHDLRRTLRKLCIQAHGMWISWITEELSGLLARDLREDDSLSTTTPLKGWEEIILKQEQEDGGQLEIKMALPAMPSLYITAFLFQGCREIYRIGGHVLDKVILQLFAWRLLEKVLNVYEDFLLNSKAFRCRVSEKGLLQVLFDLRFVADVLSGGQDIPIDTFDVENKENQPDSNFMSTVSYKSKQVLAKAGASEVARRKRVATLIQNLCEGLDPIDWATYEPHLWENERQSYQRCAVLFGFLVQLNRMYTDTVQKLPTNADTNTLKMYAAVPRFSYLPVSAPLLSPNGTSAPTMHQTSSDELTARSSWKAYSNGDLSSKFDLEDNSSFGVATPLLKSLMSQVGSKFGEGTFKLGSMLSDGQVGRLKDKSAAAMSTFGDMLPVQAAGLLSSLTVGTGKPES